MQMDVWYDLILREMSGPGPEPIDAIEEGLPAAAEEPGEDVLPRAPDFF
jgi:hypothetical protein